MVTTSPASALNHKYPDASRRMLQYLHVTLGNVPVLGKHLNFDAVGVDPQVLLRGSKSSTYPRVQSRGLPVPDLSTSPILCLPIMIPISTLYLFVKH